MINLNLDKISVKGGKISESVLDIAPFLYNMYKLVKFIYSEKATKFCGIFFLLLTAVHREIVPTAEITKEEEMKEVKFIYSEKATKFCGISTFLLSYVLPVRSKVKIL